jgi:hypothetical protein
VGVATHCQKRKRSGILMSVGISLISPLQPLKEIIQLSANYFFWLTVVHAGPAAILPKTGKQII